MEGSYGHLQLRRALFSFQGFVRMATVFGFQLANHVQYCRLANLDDRFGQTRYAKQCGYSVEFGGHEKAKSEVIENKKQHHHLSQSEWETNLSIMSFR